MKHKVSELEGPLLDAAVALAEGWRKGNHGLDHFRPLGQGWTASARIAAGPNRTEDGEVWAPEPWPWSSDWSYGGPIIERERINLERLDLAYTNADPLPAGWYATMPDDTRRGGDTPLPAAMRAYVASRFGENVELP